jgi:hypothetical protein
LATIEEFKQAFAGARSKSSPSTAPSRPASSRPRQDPLDQMLEDLVGDPQERLEALARWDVPRFSKEYENDTPLDQFLADMESGTAKANEYIGYVNQAIEYYEKYGDAAGLEDIGKAVQGLKKITKQLSGGLKNVGKVLKEVQNLKRWIEAVDGFATDSQGLADALSGGDRQAVKRWVGSLERLFDATAPYVEWLQSKAFQAALQGSRAAAALGATLPIITAQLYVAIKVLKAGIENVDAYFARLEKWQKIADEAEGGRPPPPDPPPLPGEWKSREEQAADAIHRENYELRARIRADHDNKVRNATADFEERVFPELYERTLKKHIQQELLRFETAFDVKQSQVSAQIEKLESEKAQIEAQLVQVRERTAAQVERGVRDERLLQLESTLESRIDEVDGRIDAIRSESRQLFDPETIVRLNDWKSALTTGDVRTQIVEFQHLRESRRGFPEFDKAYNRALQDHLSRTAPLTK